MEGINTGAFDIYRYSKQPGTSLVSEGASGQLFSFTPADALIVAGDGDPRHRVRQVSSPTERRLYIFGQTHDGACAARPGEGLDLEMAFI